MTETIAVDIKERVAAMRKLANWYHSLGANLAPLGDDKKPVATGVWQGKIKHFKWQDWQTTVQSERLWAAIRGESYWEEVFGVAVICGFGGWINIDIDSAAKENPSLPPVPREVALRFLRALGLPDDYPWLCATPSGGWHIFARVQALTLDDDKGRLDQLMPDEPTVEHVELRWVGHYVALPGTLHPNGGTYAFANAQPDDAPDWVDGAALLAAYQSLTVPKPEKKSASSAPARSTSASNHSAYVAKAVQDECDKVASAPSGSRNDTLNHSAFALGTLVGAGALAQGEAEDRLLSAALQCGLEEGEASATITSGISSGVKSPRQLPESALQPSTPADDDWIEALFSTDSPVLWDADNAVGRVPLGAINKTWKYLRRLLEYRAEEAGIIDCWLEEYEDSRLYVRGQGWFAWQETHWQRDPLISVKREIIAILNDFNQEARALLKLLPPKTKDDEFESERAALGRMISATQLSSNRVSSIETLAREFCSRRIDDMNQGNLLNLSNGTLDLDALRLHKHNKSDLLSDCLPYAFDPFADCPNWKRFITEVIVQEREDDALPWETDFETLDILQEAIGYTLTTDTSLESMFLLLGDGSNGKSTVISVIQRLMGSLACNVNFQAVGQPGNYDLASIPGKRMIFSTEARKNAPMAEETIKMIVTGEVIRSREIRETAFEFTPVGKIWWAMNEKPRMSDTTKGIWRRMQLLPFLRSFSKSEIDTSLKFKLFDELPGILNWALDGLRRLKARGNFALSSAVSKAIEEYRFESNPVLQWLEECAIREGDDEWQHLVAMGNMPSTTAPECHQSYVEWAKQNARTPYSNTTFGRELSKVVQRKHTRNGNTYPLSLRASTPRQTTSRTSHSHWTEGL